MGAEAWLEQQCTSLAVEGEGLDGWESVVEAAATEKEEGKGLRQLRVQDDEVVYLKNGTDRANHNKADILLRDLRRTWRDAAPLDPEVGGRPVSGRQESFHPDVPAVP